MRDVSLGEFELIDQFFKHAGARRDDVRVGIGDDGAVVAVAAGLDVVTAVQTVVGGERDGADSGRRAAELAIRDLAAIGAEPAWMMLALTVPEADVQWLERFSAGIERVCREHRVALVGGDTTHGDPIVTVVVHGLLPAGAPRKPPSHSRSRARMRT